jgi:prenyltransferase beta subunit
MNMDGKELLQPRPCAALSTRFAGVAVAVMMMCMSGAPASAQEELLPKHVTPETVTAVKKGLDFLASQQAPDGSFTTHPDGKTYPCAMTALAGMAFLSNGSTPSRGSYADQVRKVTSYLLSQAHEDGLIAAPAEAGYSMYGHGYSMMFLSCVYGMETDTARREQISAVVKRAIQLTASAQSGFGGWIYTPGGGDEGSVTVTQLQGLRAAHDAGFTVPKGTIEKAVRYLEICKTAEGGIRYSYYSGGDTRLPITAAAVDCLYSAGEYDSQLAESCLKYVYRQFKASGSEFQSGHYFYLHLYASQAFYQAGDEYWDDYFPATRDGLLAKQQADGSWQGDGVGPIFDTSLATILLQLPYKFLPIYQR